MDIINSSKFQVYKVMTDYDKYMEFCLHVELVDFLTDSFHIVVANC